MDFFESENEKLFHHAFSLSPRVLSLFSFRNSSPFPLFSVFVSVVKVVIASIWICIQFVVNDLMDFLSDARMPYSKQDDQLNSINRTDISVLQNAKQCGELWCVRRNGDATQRPLPTVSSKSQTNSNRFNGTFVPTVTLGILSGMYFLMGRHMLWTMFVVVVVVSVVSHLSDYFPK